MINQLLHRQPLAVDRDAHRQLRIDVPITDWSVASRLNSLFVAAVEFADACREYPIVFVRAGKDPAGKEQIAPVAVFGMAQEENLFLDGTRWRAAYLPAQLRLYPFCIGRLDEQRFAICFDSAWGGASHDKGQALFDADGKPTELMDNVQKQMEAFEKEVQRTRLVGDKLLELDLLRDMRFDAELPGGQKLSVDGFLTVDEAKLNALPDARLLELQRSGLLGLIHAHFISLGNMRRLAEWRAQRQVAMAPGGTA